MYCRKIKNLLKKKLVIHNFGNVSIRIDDKYFIIKPSGAILKNLKPSDMPVVNILSRKKIAGKLNPSTDTPTHLEIYKKYKKIKSITHTHSAYATTWAQSAKPIPLIGTTHADFWEKEVPLVDYINKISLNKNYEKITGTMIIKTLEKKKIRRLHMPWSNCCGSWTFYLGNEKS